MKTETITLSDLNNTIEITLGIFKNTVLINGGKIIDNNKEELTTSEEYKHILEENSQKTEYKLTIISPIFKKKLLPYIKMEK